MQQIATNPIPKISVIVPAYNTAGLIAGCLSSVLSQTYRDFEVLVVNDGSPDTPELEAALEPYAARIRYIKQENKRAAGARNTAIRVARGEFVAFLDSDDTWLPEHLSAQMDLVAKDPSLDMVYANAMLIGNPERQRQFTQECPSRGVANFESLIMEQCQIPISTVVVRRSALVKAGLFDETLLRCDDYDMWVRAAFYGAKIGYSRKVQALLNEGRPGSLGASKFKMVEAYWMILEKIESTLPLNQIQRRVVQQRTTEIKSRSNYERAKCELGDGHFGSAIQLLSEANQQMRKTKLSITLAGLKIAPGLTWKVWSLWGRLRAGRAA